MLAPESILGRDLYHGKFPKYPRDRLYDTAPSFPSIGGGGASSSRPLFKDDVRETSAASSSRTRLNQTDPGPGIPSIRLSSPPKPRAATAPNSARNRRRARLVPPPKSKELFPAIAPGRGPARRQWHNDVGSWMKAHGKDQRRRLAKGEERELNTWFEMLDVDRSGSVEAEEIEALLTAVGINPSEKEIAGMFDSIGMPVTASLTHADFVRLMTLEGQGMFFKLMGKLGVPMNLLMLSYRRSLILDDLEHERWADVLEKIETSPTNQSSHDEVALPSI